MLPIAFFSGSVVLYLLAGHDFLLQVISIVLTVYFGIKMEINALQLKENRFKYAIFDLIFSTIIVAISIYGNKAMGNIFTTICIVIITVVYIQYVYSKRVAIRW